MPTNSQRGRTGWGLREWIQRHDVGWNSHTIKMLANYSDLTGIMVSKGIHSHSWPYLPGEWNLVYPEFMLAGWWFFEQMCSYLILLWSWPKHVGKESDGLVLLVWHQMTYFVGPGYWRTTPIWIYLTCFVARPWPPTTWECRLDPNYSSNC